MILLSGVMVQRRVLKRFSSGFQHIPSLFLLHTDDGEFTST
jgi:hypothetical protein